MLNGLMNKRRGIDWIINPTPHCQAHWLVAQNANARPKPAKEIVNPNARTDIEINTKT